MAKAFARMTQGFASLVRQVRDSASQVASGAGQMAGASDESAKVSVQAASAIDEVTSTMHEMSINVQNVVKNTQVQASSVAETSASIDQMVTSIQRVADTAKLLVDISHRSREEARTGMATMDKATEGLNRTSHAIQSSAEIIDALGRRADDIGKIIEVIDDLAEQTNLLALNAAIEAARAGEHGLGFAVVAEEVRKLAEKSTQSTKEISELIQGIQKEAREAVDNMEKSTTMVEEGLVAEQGSQPCARQNFRRGLRSLQILAGNRRGHHGAIEWLGADRQGHEPTDGNHAGDQFLRRRTGLRGASGRARDGTDARAGAAIHFELNRAGRRRRADVQALPGVA